MLKLKLPRKQPRFPLSSHETLRFFRSASTAASMADSDARAPYKLIPEPPFSRPLEPQRVISALLLSKSVLQVKEIHAKVFVNGMLRKSLRTSSFTYTLSAQSARRRLRVVSWRGKGEPSYLERNSWCVFEGTWWIL
ncbi:uncharacterized protein LOC112091093 [Morus notabilis]|uniref:uncharacterized protein LOC112091093 n=1 Tax=Morus notabilis TaxID=981085 RepID=UPI000CECFB50|nr:uncharacterized protein LOC112091093 [Morus notabilis]